MATKPKKVQELCELKSQLVTRSEEKLVGDTAPVALPPPKQPGKRESAPVPSVMCSPQTYEAEGRVDWPKLSINLIPPTTNKGWLTCICLSPLEEKHIPVTHSFKTRGDEKNILAAHFFKTRGGSKQHPSDKFLYKPEKMKQMLKQMEAYGWSHECSVGVQIPPRRLRCRRAPQGCRRLPVSRRWGLETTCFFN